MSLPQPSPAGDPAALLRAVRERTPARVLAGRAGPSYLTDTLLSLRADHAAALDAVRGELDRDLVERLGLFEVGTLARDKAEHLLRPDLGRRLNDAAREEVVRRCPAGADLQVVVGDGLSAAAVHAQVPALLPLLEQGARDLGWRFGKPFVVRYCRVGVLNDVGALLAPTVVVLLVGERPGLATAESLSAYLAYRPRPGDSDARRNLVSNVHTRGVPCAAAARRVLALAGRMRVLQASGVAVKEALPP
jgi:ethanolamine ammonia-lyase small subunit